jgi:hypothetical protein
MYDGLNNSGRHRPAECDVIGDVDDWGIGMFVTSEFGDVVE